MKTFSRIWRHLAKAGKCDSHNSAEYAHVRKLWIAANKPFAIAAFIILHANKGIK